MREILILLACFNVIQSDIDIDNPPEDINDLFPTIDNNSSDLTFNVNTTFDIGKIDVKKLMQKIGSFNTSVMDYPLNDTRRQVLVYSFLSKSWYQSASDHMTRQKTTDLMLQTIYMTKHIMKELESNPNFNKKDTGYRIGFLYKKLLGLIEKVQDIYTIMYNHRYGWSKVLNHLLLHHRAVKLHTDFTYLWWVLIKVDGKHKEKNNSPQKLPKSLKNTGGLSEENENMG